MKVVLICRSFDKNSGQGIYKMAGYLYENLKKCNGVEIQKVEGYKNQYYFDLVESLIKVRKFSFDVYHFLMPEVCAPILFYPKVREKSIAVIHDLIIYKFKERKWLSEKYIKFMYRVAKKAKIIIVPSNQTKRDLVELFNISEDRILYLPWGVDLEHFKPKIGKRSKNKKLTIGYVGGLGKRKNVEWLLYLAKYFGDEVHLKIAGAGPMLIPLIELKKRLHLNNVEFVGFINEGQLPDFYNSIDVFIFPSLYEGFGIPLVEAMACEVPYIIGTNAGIGEFLPIYKISSMLDLTSIVGKIIERKLKPLKNQRQWITKCRLTWNDYIQKLMEVYSNI